MEVQHIVQLTLILQNDYCHFTLLSAEAPLFQDFVQVLIFCNRFAVVNGCKEVGYEEAKPLRMKIRNRLLSCLCLQVTRIALIEVLVLSILCDAI